MKRLQEETMTKMAVLGRGSMRDKQKVRKTTTNFPLTYCQRMVAYSVRVRTVRTSVVVESGSGATRVGIPRHSDTIWGKSQVRLPHPN